MSQVRPFQVLIKPAGADCNLRCGYCFYLRTEGLYEHKGVHRMSGDVLDTLVRGLLSYRFRETVFAWQGGEPTLMGVDFFYKAVEAQKRHGADGQVVGNGIQTNGILIDEDWCRLFHDYHFLVGLSLDGPHDRVRQNAAGKGTWDKVMAAAGLMPRHKVEFNILCVVNAENVHMGADLCRWLVRQGFDYLQFIPCFEPGMPHNVPPEVYGDFLCDTFDYWRKEGVGRVSIRDFESLLQGHLGHPPSICTFGRRCNHYIVIEHDGDVYPCDFFVRDGWKLGNILDQPLHTFMETEAYKRFAKRKDNVPQCRGCRWRAMCYGGCQKDRLVQGRIDAPSGLCPAYKKFFAHVAPKLGKIAKRFQLSPAGRTT